MSEWWTYRLSDLLLFSPRAYWALFGQENAALWPLPPIAAGLGCLLIVLAARAGRWSAPITFGLIAIAWGWVGWSFFGQRYSMINWAASYMAPVFAVQAAIALAFLRRSVRRPPRPAAGADRLIAIGLIAYATLIHPLWSVLLGRPLGTAEILGIAPDPTAVATLGAGLAFLGGSARWVFFAIPLLWLLVSAVTLFTMDAAQGWALVTVAALAVIGALPERAPESLPDLSDKTTRQDKEKVSTIDST